jgi:hypothetical protein
VDIFIQQIINGADRPRGRSVPSAALRKRLGMKR